MGVLPLEFTAGASAATLGLTGREVFDLIGSGEQLTPRGEIVVRATREAGARDFAVRVRIDTPEELTAFSHGGILPYVLRQLVRKQ
jgi:aconitate hydratase